MSDEIKTSQPEVEFRSEGCVRFCISGSEAYVEKTHTTHPWEIFLSARADAIKWMNEEMNYSDAEIAVALSMDEQQVYLIRNRWQ